MSHGIAIDNFMKTQICMKYNRSQALRVRTILHQTFQVYHVYCSFIVGYICQITVNFETLKDESHLIKFFA